MKLVFDIGGSVICPKGFPDTEYIKKFSKFTVNLKNRKHEIVIVAGGGKLAKHYIKSTRIFKPREDFLDILGIQATRMNAMVLLASLGEHAYPVVVKNKEELEHALTQKKIIVMGGTVVSQTTDAVSVAVAEFFGADMIIIGKDVKGIYDKDPKKHRNAKLMNNIPVKDLISMVSTKEHKAGPNTVMDQKAAKLLSGVGIKTVVLDGGNLENMKKAIQGRKFVGTTINV